MISSQCPKLCSDDGDKVQEGSTRTAKARLWAHFREPEVETDTGAKCQEPQFKMERGSENWYILNSMNTKELNSEGDIGQKPGNPFFIP